jgi:hypothetical protein
MLGISKILSAYVVFKFSNYYFVFLLFLFYLRTPTAVVCIPIVVGVPQFDKPCFTDIRQLFTIFDISIVP